MMTKALILIFLAYLTALVYVTAQSTDNPTSTSSTASTSTSTSMAPTNNTCTKHGRYPATNERCTPDYIVCIPNFAGGFFQYRWRCAGTLVFNENFKKCTSPRKANCLNSTTTTTTTTTSTTQSSTAASSTTSTTAAPSL